MDFAMPTARTRFRDSALISGSGTYLGSPTSKSFYSRRSRCDDVVGDYGGNHTLTIRHYTITGSMLIKQSGNLIFPDPGCPTEWYGYDVSNMAGQPALSSYVNRVLATTGPLTPNINLPLSLFELKDVPSMLRHAGNLLHKIRRPSGLSPLKEAAAANLAYKFGWAPIVGDLNKLLNFADAARRQQQRIEGAYSKKGIRRRIKLDSNAYQTSGLTYIWSTFGLLLQPEYTKTAQSNAWATVRWKVRDPSKYGYKPSFNEALRTSLGFNLGQVPIQVWKALPWSWMVDWFTDISNVMQANYNSIYFKPSRLSIMRTTLNVLRHKQIDRINGDPNNYVTPGFYAAEYKERYANNSPSASITLRLPFMDNYKLSVLGSLAILKSR